MRALVVLALCGCRGILGIGDPVVASDGTVGDGPLGTDTPGEGLPPGCYGTTGWLLCLDAPPADPIALGGTTIDTDLSPQCLAAAPASWTATGQPDACVIAGATLMVSAPLTVTGSRPLVLLADDTLQLLALVDVASHGAGTVGPAANASACIAGGNGGNSANGAGGAAGGSVVAPGGDGGTGTGAGGGGNTATVLVPDVLRGGCPGGRGGAGQGGGTGGVGGASGGAVFLVAGGSITITSSVNASGAGGRGGTARGGGGGGGSGGMIAVYAPTLDISGTVVANGGGGAEGANDAAAGGNGSDPDPATALVAASGGAGGSTAAGNGGAGGAGTLAAQNGTNAAGGSSSGGGGGGGSVGVIRVLSGQSIGGTASPPAVP